MYRRSTSSLLMFFWLAFGYAVIHGTASVWLGSMLQSIIGPATSFESLVFKEDGEAAIQVYVRHGAGYAYRHLDGSPYEESYGLGNHPTTPVWFSPLKDVGGDATANSAYWPWRITPFHDFRTAATNWYLIQPPERGNTAFFVGYDPVSRARVGYIGVNGFSAEEPARHDSFDLSDDSWALGTHVVSAQHAWHHAGEVYEPNASGVEGRYATKANVSPDMVWILAKGTVYQVRLQSRSVEILFDTADDRQNVARIEVNRDDKTYLQLAFRTEKELQFLDPETKEIQRTDINQISTADQLRLYQLKNGNRILVARPSGTHYLESTSYKESIYWLNSEGQIERTAEAQLASQRQMNQTFQTGMMFVGCPSLIVPCAVNLLGPVIQPLAFRDPLGASTSYATKVRKAFDQSKLWVMLSLLGGLLLGWRCRWREVTLFGNREWLWPVLIGLTGWFGWIGYIFMRPQPARLPNRQWMPSQPEPVRPIGTEIYA